MLVSKGGKEVQVLSSLSWAARDRLLAAAISLPPPSLPQQGQSISALSGLFGHQWDSCKQTDMQIKEIPGKQVFFLPLSLKVSVCV